jgi:type I restriction enzyme, S subunit
MKWPLVKLEDIVLDMQPGFAMQPDREDIGVPHLRTNNVSEDGHMDLSSIKRVKSSKEQIDKYSLDHGDILFNNTNSPALVGKTAFFEGESTFLFSNHMTRIRVNGKVADPRFIARYLHWIWATGGFRAMVTQWVNQAAINRSQLARLCLSLPPLSEQRRIVEILDQADALRKKRVEADAKSIRIMRAVFIKIFGNPDEWTPNGGNTRPLASLVEICGGGTPSKKNSDFWKGEIPWVSPKDMKQDVLYDSDDYISPFAVEHANLKYINPGAVLIVVRCMILAHTVPIAMVGSRLTINQDMKALEPKSTDINPIYLYASLKVSEHILLSKVRTAAHGTRKIDTEELLQLPILIPARKDADRFHRIITEYNENSSGIGKTRAMIERLFENLLHRAFSGDLTAKWRETHMKELFTEMKEQSKHLAACGTHSLWENAALQESLF